MMLTQTQQVFVFAQFLLPPPLRSRQLELEDKHSTLELELRKCMEIKGAYLCGQTGVCWRFKEPNQRLGSSNGQCRLILSQVRASVFRRCAMHFFFSLEGVLLNTLLQNSIF